MQAKIYPILAAALILTTLAVQGCFETPAPYYYGSSAYQTPAYEAPAYATRKNLNHEEREWTYGPKRTVCDAYGNNCMVCDADNDYCRRTSRFFGIF